MKPAVKTRLKARSRKKETLRELIDFLARGAEATARTGADGEESIHAARVHAKRMTAALHLFKPVIARDKFRQERELSARLGDFGGAPQ